MKAVLLALAALLAAAMPASAEVFDVPIPELGRVRAVAGFAPGKDQNGEPVGEFAGNVSTPFVAYVKIYRAPDGPELVMREEVRITTPSGRVMPGIFTHRWTAASEATYLYWDMRSLDEWGDYRFQFLFNDVEVARLTLVHKVRD